MLSGVFSVLLLSALICFLDSMCFFYPRSFLLLTRSCRVDCRFWYIGYWLWPIFLRSPCDWCVCKASLSKMPQAVPSVIQCFAPCLVSLWCSVACLSCWACRLWARGHSPWWMVLILRPFQPNSQFFFYSLCLEYLKSLSFNINQCYID